MIRELVMTALVSATFGGASVGAGMKFYADHIYTLQTASEAEHEELEVLIAAVDARQTQASNVQRVKQLQGWIAATRRRAEYAGRPLTTAEANDIKEWETEIVNIRQGW